METSTIDKLLGAAAMKRDLLREQPNHYIVRAMLAGMYVGMAVVMAFRLAQPFYEAGSPATYFINAIFFGVAFCLILYGKTELFTSNTMYMVVGAMKKTTNWMDTLRVWGACYLGNLVGILFFTGLIIMTGLFATMDPSESYLITAAEKKMNLPYSEMFFRAILANWLVCLAVWIPLQVKDDIAKIALMILFVFTFFISGYEHSIANMALFSIALTAPHTALVTMQAAIENVVIVTLGNIVGGAFFVGVLYTYLNSAKKEAAVQSKVKAASGERTALEK
ncbi:formate/nitrite transporter family protein [Jeotgalibacillus sp. R-1-5s-1]|uniref:formate/nitrite transporter family protein n=1 Tax=Jeotgalibacillus sp. R-1-5s-1 TaxID=2555897 RepID=UPI00106AF943|nr:formate/nitrite transporter family protein [Jeotgalibacillus sp. R-1-5s-1]TFD93617.1 formate/nitrite transporter family protein [Jeotgalibacillus sp. R-1-5s-1]